ncbi:M28 family peptidase [uncultured Agrococcus sp.]|uniref:M28 family peptidase n=1 Tax=uncultured Agrococcus sp. TaxID=382258 RepID=UPI0025E421F8|nr:M28 family peptidase [uncultured Agrococcus sp.]
MLAQKPPSSARFRPKRSLYALGAAALALPLIVIPTAATAQESSAGDAFDAITSGELLPGFGQEFLEQIDPDSVWAHNEILSVDIGPRVAGTDAEDAAVDYIGGLLDEYGFETEVETFDAREQVYANVEPNRFTDEYASWQFRPAANGVFTGADNPVDAAVVDLGAAEAGGDFGDLSGLIAVVDWMQEASDRNALLADLRDAGVEAVVLVQTSGAESLPNPGDLPEQLQDMVVVAAATNQGERIRTLLEDGDLSLSITTEQSRADSSNIIGVLPAAGGEEDAPIVYIGAHIDSVVGSPGASDNGSGVSIMLEVARIISQYELGVEIRVGGWGAEEIGIVGSRYHAESLTDGEIERTIGAWNMDMAGTSYEGNPGQPFGFWALTVDGDTAEENEVLFYADESSRGAGHGDLQIGQVGRSDHQSFRDVGIDAAVFSWMFWAGGTNIVLEPTYHQTTDTLEFVSHERMGISAQVVGGAAFRAGLHDVDVAVIDENGAPAADAQVAMSCQGDEGWRDAGTVTGDGTLRTHAPNTTCDFAAMAENGARAIELGVAFEGPGEVSLELQLDDTAPVVSLSVDAEAGASGWHTTAPVRVSIAATDDVDSAPAVEYSLDGEAWLPYEEAVELSEEGIHAVHARATDDLGNASEVVSDEFRIDTVKPTLTGTPDAETRGAVLLEGADATSGLDGVEYRLGSGDEWTVVESEFDETGTLVATLPISDAAEQVELRAFDVAGNSSDIVEIAWPAAEGSDGSLPSTGVAFNGLAAGIAALLALGGALVLRSRLSKRAGA